MGQSFEVQIQQLFQAGVATHIVKNADSIDPIFALSKVKDFPEVNFAASFEDGTVVLGCADQLPEPLVTLASPIAHFELPTSNPLEEKLEAFLETFAPPEDTDPVRTVVTEELARLSTIMDHQVALSTTLQDQLAALTTQAAQNQSNAKGTLADDPAISALHAQVTVISEAMREKTEPKDLSHQIAQLCNDISSALNAQEKRQPHLLRDEIENGTRGFAEDIAEKIMAAMKADALPHADAISGRQDEIAQSISTVSNDLRALIAMHGAATQPAASDDLALEMVNAISALPVFAMIDETLPKISARLTSLEDVHRTTSGTIPDELTAQINTLVAEVSEIAHHPAPTLDLTEQRQGIARFQTAMATVLARLEAAVARLATLEEPETQADPDAWKSEVGGLHQKLAPLELVPAQLTEIAAYLNNLPKLNDTIGLQLQELTARIDPAAGQAAQRQSLAHFTQALSTIVSRMESIADGQTQSMNQDDTTAELARIEATIAQQKSGDLIDILAQHNRELGDMRAELATLFARPAPVIDLSAQRKSFAQFGTALGSVVARFERIADQIEPLTQLKHASDPAGTMQDDTNQATQRFSDNRISLEELRYEFAELIAKQIKDNTASHEQ